jgi:hypothetical protein
MPETSRLFFLSVQHSSRGKQGAPLQACLVRAMTNGTSRVKFVLAVGEFGNGEAVPIRSKKWRIIVERLG